ncbi:MAG TPA: tail fiber domain-containing protein [candidate division Zixibacteria bacterium]|nr:tail fiber domain-containing protein [candidate division Zixibacteria bacterium]
MDADGDGNPEAGAQTLVMADSVIDVLDTDSDDDGLSDVEIRREVMQSAARLAIKTKGTGAQRTAVTAGTDDSTATIEGGFDLDGDDAPEQQISSAITPTKSQHAINTKGTGAQNGRVVSVRSVTTVDSAAQTVYVDNDDDNNKEAKVTVTASPESGLSPLQVRLACELDSDDDGTPDVTSVDVCDPDSASHELTYSYQNAALLPVYLTVKEKANKTVCKNQLRQSGPSSETEAELSCDSAVASSFWRADNFTGAPVSVTIQASADNSLNPIEHSSGAHLTPGGVWTNASDESLKEGFCEVDGFALLERLESLTITEWNYKTEADSVRHIGPTAQEFQKAFGVGSDGKSISTIDPAGIALAALKALNEKSKRIDDLEAKVAELTRLLEELSAAGE